MQRKALRQLAILPKSAARALPESVLCELWQLSTGETEDLVATMESLGICRGLENAIGAPSIAIPWEFILEQEAAESASQLRAWHEELARRLLMSPPAIRHSTASAFSLDDYMGENLARHMVGGALATELRGLLCDFDWLEAMLIAHGAEATRSAWERSERRGCALAHRSCSG